MRFFRFSYSLGILAFCLLPFNVMAQNFDKADADKFVYEQLVNNGGGKRYVKKINLDGAILEGTSEENIKILKGNSFQVNSLRSDIYIDYAAKSPLYGKRYPLESAVNALMNVVDNSYQLNITHRQYGKIKKQFTLPLQSVHYVLDAGMETFCSVTQINKEMMEATLVFHNSKKNFIHMFVISIPMSEMFKEDGTFNAELYTNIPQGEVKSFFGKKKQIR